jgi:hypothetical protein
MGTITCSLVALSSPPVQWIVVGSARVLTESGDMWNGLDPIGGVDNCICPRAVSIILGCIIVTYFVVEPLRTKIYAAGHEKNDSQNK